MSAQQVWVLLGVGLQGLREISQGGGLSRGGAVLGGILLDALLRSRVHWGL